MSKTWTQAALDAPTDTSPAGSDLITFVDVSAGRTEQATVDNLSGRRGASFEGVLVDSCTNAAPWDRLTAGTGTITAAGTADPIVGPYLSLAATSAGTLVRRGRYLHVDLSDKVLSFKIRRDANLSVLDIYLGAGNTYDLTKFFRYNQSVTPFRVGAWETISFSPAYAVKTGVTAADLDDIRQIAIQITPTGGTTTTLDIADIRVHDKQGREPGVIWQFDDGFLSTYTTAYPYLESNGFVGSVGPMPDRYAPGDAAYMSIAQLQTLHSAGWEIWSHYNTRYIDVSQSQAEANMRTAKSFLIDNGLTRGADFLAWPNSDWTTALEDAAHEMFRGLRRFGALTTQWCGEMHTLNTRDVPHVPVTSTQLVATVKGYLDSIAAYGGIANLVFHDLVTSGATGANYLIANFEEIVDYAASLGLRSTTMTEEWGGMSVNAPFTVPPPL